VDKGMMIRERDGVSHTTLAVSAFSWYESRRLLATSPSSGEDVVGVVAS